MIGEMLDRMEKEPIMPILKKLELEEEHSWDLNRVNVVKPTAKQVEWATGKKFQTSIKKVEGKVTVKRIK